MSWWNKQAPEPAPVKLAPSVWDSIDLDEKVAPNWPLIVANPIWTRELLPWFRGLLIQTVKQLTVERDPDTILALQVRVRLIEGLIQQPEIEVVRLRAEMQNRVESGDIEREVAYGRR